MNEPNKKLWGAEEKDTRHNSMTDLALKQPNLIQKIKQSVSQAKASVQPKQSSSWRTRPTPPPCHTSLLQRCFGACEFAEGGLFKVGFHEAKRRAEVHLPGPKLYLHTHGAVFRAEWTTELIPPMKKMKRMDVARPFPERTTRAHGIHSKPSHMASNRKRCVPSPVFKRKAPKL